MTTRTRKIVEGPTLALLIACYGGWGLAVTVLSLVWLPLAIALCCLCIVLHSSLQHETIHGPTLLTQSLSDWLVALPIGLAIPFARFRDTHLDHHRDSRLTDPYDDPESNYLDPGHWDRLGAPARLILSANNTLLGRMLLGPAIGQIAFMACDLRAIRRGDMAVILAWVWHGLGLAVLAALLARFGTMPIWAYLASAYLGLSILKIRTYLEHRAHERASGRTVIIEDRGPLALLFLNNNFHAVHHCHPSIAWYNLPGKYAAARDSYLARNDGYRYRSYAQVFRQHFLRRKDPVAHPLWRRE